MQVQHLWYDNTGENVAFKKAYNQEGLGVEFEYTASVMQQEKGQVKWKFATIFNTVHAILHIGKFNTYLRTGLWTEVVNTAMLLKNNLVTLNIDISPF